MSDLLVDTTAQRSAAAHLRAAARVAEEAAEKSGRLGWYVSAAGPGRAARALADFLGEWTYGMGLIGHQVEVLASYLETAALAYETAEAQLTAAAGGRVTAPASFVPLAPLPEPPARRPVMLVNDLSPMALPLTLATATHPSQLLPGEPHELTRLAGILRGFANSAADAVDGLRSLSTGSWQGEAAVAFAGHVQQAPDRLVVASQSFDAAAVALTRFAGELEDAQRRVAAGFAAFKDAEARAAAEIPGAQEEMTAAATAVARAQAEVDDAGRVLAQVLEEEGSRAPNEPGLLARMTKAVGSFLGGVGEGTVGMVTGVVALGELAYKLSPQYAMTDPQGYLRTVKGVLAGVEFAATHPTETAKVLVDWDTWADDPARAAGRLVPELLLTLATGGAGAAAKGAKVADSAGDLASVATKADDLAELGHVDELAAAARPSQTMSEAARAYARGGDIPTTGPAADLFPDDYRRFGDLTEDEFLDTYWDPAAREGDGGWRYPDEEGFAGPAIPHRLQVGDVIDRFGPADGRYLSPADTPFDQRAIPPSSVASPYTQYRVLRELPDAVLEGRIAPWFEQPGGGLQYKFDEKISWYLREGYVEEIRPG